MSKIPSKNKNKVALPKQRGFIITHPQHSGRQDNLQLLRITCTPFETKFDFGYQATDYYFRGGWIEISPKTFIRPTDTQKKLILTNASNIPFGPEKHHFNSSMEWRYFSLHFPSLFRDVTETKTKMIELPSALSCSSIDLIENEFGNETDFNFYDIRLDEEPKISLLYR